MSNLEKVFKERMTVKELLTYDQEERLFYICKYPEIELPEFEESQGNNPKPLEDLARKVIAKSLNLNQINKEIYPSTNLDVRNLQTLRELQINSKNPNDLKIEGLRLPIFNKLKEKNLLRAFNELDLQEKKIISKENWNDIEIERFIKNKNQNTFYKYFSDPLELGGYMIKFNFDNFIKKRIEILIENLTKIIPYLNKEQKDILSNLSGKILLALSKIKDLHFVLLALNQQDLTPELFKLGADEIEALSKIDNLDSVIFCLNNKGLTLELFKLDNEKLLALSKIDNLDSVIFCLNDKGLTPKFLEFNNDKIEALSKIENLTGVIAHLNEKGLTLELFKLDNEKLLALSEIENLNSVISYLNDKGLTPKFLGLPIETLQDPKLIKQALGIDFEIEMKKPAKTEPAQTMEFSDFSSPRSSPNI